MNAKTRKSVPSAVGPLEDTPTTRQPVAGCRRRVGGMFGAGILSLGCGLAFSVAVGPEARGASIGFQDIGIRQASPSRGCGDLEEQGPREGYLRMVLRELAESDELGELGGDDARNLYLLANAGPAQFGFPLIAWIRSDEKRVEEFMRGKRTVNWVDEALSEPWDTPAVGKWSEPVMSLGRPPRDIDWRPMDKVKSGEADLDSWDWTALWKTALEEDSPIGGWPKPLGGSVFGDGQLGAAPSAIPDAGGTLQLLSLGLAALAGIGWVRCRGESVPR